MFEKPFPLVLIKRRIDFIMVFFVGISAILVGCIPTQNEATGPVFITSAGSPPADSIAWSPKDENKILVTSGDIGHGQAEVYVFDVGTKEKYLLAKTKYGDFVNASWFPDGDKFFFSVRDDTIGYEPSGVWTANINEGTTDYFMDLGYASSSPDGKLIAAFKIEQAESETKTINLLLIDTAAKLIKKVYSTQDANYFFGLTWSPNSEKIVFALGQNEPGELYIFDLKTGQTSLLTEMKRADSPVWSPVGDLVAYVNWPSEGINTTLHLIDIKNNCDIEIPETGFAWSPTWSPDGKKLGYIGGNGIFYLSLDKVLGEDFYKNICELQ